uniref:Uncharacterized protein n=1 Tax=Aotus nancymaae TaxID=37293 RepID=A0A2K5F9U6_AOTNA
MLLYILRSIGISSLVRFALKMSLLKKEVYFSDCPYGEIKIKFKETNAMCWHFLMHSCIFVIWHL